MPFPKQCSGFSVLATTRGPAVTHNPIHSQTELLNREKPQRQRKGDDGVVGHRVPGTSSEAPSPSEQVPGSGWDLRNGVIS